MFAAQILQKPFFSNAPGSTTFSQEHFKTQKECIMENSKIVNTWKFLSIEITLSFRGEYYNTYNTSEVIDLKLLLISQ